MTVPFLIAKREGRHRDDPRYAASLRIETVYVVYQAPLHSRTECVESHARLKWDQVRISNGARYELGTFDAEPTAGSGKASACTHPRLDYPVASQFHDRAATEAPW